jgi:Tfp pilus assembly protein PilV
MRRTSLTALAPLAMLAGLVLPVAAADMGLKPGLWETKALKMVVDGHDMLEQMASLNAQRQQMMASLPADQRAKVEAMFKSNGIGQGTDGGFRICVSPEMAKRNTPVIDKDGRCQPAKMTHSGNQTTFEISCSHNGITTSGKGSATASPDLISTQVDMTTTTANGKTQVIHSESEMHFVGSDCGDLKPPDAQAPKP